MQTPQPPDVFYLHRSVAKKRRRHRLRSWMLLFVGLVIVSAAVLMGYPVVCGWTAAPTDARQTAIDALAYARRSEAPRWAADMLAESEQLFQVTTGAESIESGRIFFQRDFRYVKEGYWSVQAKAQQAVIAALDRMVAARTASGAAVDSARGVVNSACKVAEQMSFPRRERMLLCSARMHFSEAETQMGAGEYERSCELCSQAMAEAEEAVRGAIPLAARFIAADQVSKWQDWISETISTSRRSRGTAIIVYKEENRLDLYSGGERVRTYVADMGRNSLAFKERAGDAATPEGQYRIVSKRANGQSAYHKALLLDYPNAEDRSRFEKSKRSGRLPGHARLGEYIEIHGEGGRGRDWTLGCVALSNHDIDDLYSRVDVGVPVTIVGGDGQGGTFSQLARSSTAARFLGRR